jgi:hypothetical protein
VFHSTITSSSEHLAVRKSWRQSLSNRMSRLDELWPR